MDWDEDEAVAWRPHDDPASPVRIRPAQRFGLPAIEGVKTAVMWEHLEACAGFDEVADNFGLTVDDVLWAVSYEAGAHSSAA